MKLIAGKINNSQLIYYWDASIFKLMPNLGDYAIVENMNDYDLVKVVGILETNEKYQKFITNGKVKKVITIVNRDMIRND